MIVYLASASQARQAMLASAGVETVARPSGLDEEPLKAALLADGVGPRDIADALAEAKALKVSRRVDGFVLGADQTLDLAGELLDKPRSLDKAREQLMSLRGRTHDLHAAAVIAFQGRPIWRQVSTARLHVRPFTDDFLSWYLNVEGHRLLETVGAYRIEGPGVQLFSRVSGDHFTVLGLPLLEVLEEFRRLGVCPS